MAVTIPVDSLTKYGKDIVVDIIDDYERAIKENLQKGKKVYFEGVGTLEIMERKVHNTWGRGYTVKGVVTLDKSFKDDLIEMYENDPTLFDTVSSRRKSNKQSNEEEQ